MKKVETNDPQPKSIWITGASTGLGRELAIGLAKQGHQVFASARSQAPLRELAEQYSNIIPLIFDVSDRSQMTLVKQQIESHTPRLDQIILNAGNCEYLDIKNPDWDMMRRVMDVNYFGAVNSLEAVWPLLGSGSHIVVTSSIATLSPFPKAQAYGASKAALNYFISCMKVDLREQNIDVTIVEPGFIDTPLTERNDFPMPFLMSSEKAANIILAKLDKRPFRIRFPFLFSAFLRLAFARPNIWFDWIAPKLAK